MEQSVLMKVQYNIGKKVLNVSLTGKVLGWNKLHHREEYFLGINSNRKSSLQSAGWAP